MTFSLTDTVRDALTSGGIVNGAASALGISATAASKGLEAAGTTMLAGLANKAKDPLALGELFNMAQDPALMSPTLDDPTRLLGPTVEAARARDLGGRLMSSLFGERTGDVADGLARHIGVATSSASSLMGVAAPLLLRSLGGLVRSGGLTVGSLGQALVASQGELMSAVPGPLANLVGRAQIYDVNREAQPQLPRMSQTAESRRPAWWAIPLALLPLVLLGVWFLRGGARNEQRVDPAAARQETPAAVATRTPPASQPERPPPASTPPAADPPQGDRAAAGEPQLQTVHVAEANRELRFAEAGVEAKLLQFLRDKDAQYDDKTWFEFDRLVFDSSGARLADASNEQLDNLVAILKAFPDVRIKIGGYTDDTGDTQANLDLSQRRADSVKQALVGRGIAADRVETEGYGEQHPVASNATEEGRAANRRVALRVLPPRG